MSSISKTMVLDTSVIGKLYVDEEYSKEMKELLVQGHEEDVTFKASELLFFELGNVIWKRHQGKKDSGAESLIRSYLLPLEKVSLEPEVSMDVLKIAHLYDISFYDAVHVQIAQSLGVKLVTEDRELKNKFDCAIGISEALESIGIQDQ